MKITIVGNGEKFEVHVTLMWTSLKAFAKAIVAVLSSAAVVTLASEIGRGLGILP
jgi:ABC-type enterochelin transport system permease subunit